jgi:hypothetical protein
MDKFWKLDETRVWDKGDSCIYVGSNRIGSHYSFNSEGWEPCTREEFTAAALQSIEKLKAQGIDIGTDWLPKWEPKVGEVVWCWDDNCKTLKVAKYMGKRLDGLYLHEVGNHTWQHIAPFTGEIPEPFKSRWEVVGNGPA